MSRLKLKEDDLNLLLPSFREVVVELLDVLRAKGFDPCVRDTLRTEAEAAGNAARGVGIADSVHCYGAAVDIVCFKHGWACDKYKCPFFKTLRREGMALGLFRGPEHDWPHLQGLPATKIAQDALRALGRGPESLAARDALVRRWLRAH